MAGRRGDLHQQVALLVGTRELGDVGAVRDRPALDELDGLPRAHHADPGIRPGEREGGTEIAGVHDDVGTTIRLPQRDGHEGHRRPAERAAQVGGHVGRPRAAPVLRADTAGGPGAPLGEIPVDARVELSVSWAASDAESYTYYDRAQQVLSQRREAMRVSWYTNAGTLDTESTGRAENDLALTAQNHWLAPENPGTYWLWVVLRDSRGGVDFASYRLSVQP